MNKKIDLINLKGKYFSPKKLALGEKLLQRAKFLMKLKEKLNIS